MDEEERQQRLLGEIRSIVKAEVNEKMVELSDQIKQSRQEAKQRDKKMRRELSDRMARLENRVEGSEVLGRGRGPEPVHYVSTGTGLIDPEWRWEREHPFRR